jgi:hypothetical protein
VEEDVRELNSRGSCTFLYPLGELYLTPAVGREFRVDRVTFVHKDRLPLVRKKFGLRTTVSEIKKREPARQFFEDAQTWAFAVVRQGGEQNEVEQRCLELIREELAILASSQLGHKTRKQMGPIASPGEISSSYITFLAIDSRSTQWFQNMFRRTRPYSQVVMDWGWKRYQDLMFFTSLLKILRKDTKVDAGWRDELRRAAVLTGESVSANDPFKSFLWNMVALEMLLTKDETGKTKDILPRRIGALLDCVPHWWTMDYKELIEDVYDKRNRLLHQGRRDELTEWDLAFTDHLLLHVLANLVKHPKLFPSKDAFIEFTEKVEAERTLGVKPKVRPESLIFVDNLKVRPPT